MLLVRKSSYLVFLSLVARRTVAIVPHGRPGGFPAGLLGLRHDNDAENKKTEEKEEVAPSWEELKERVSEGRFDEFCRAPNVQRTYTDFLDEVRENWHSIEDMLVCRVFEIGQINDNGKLRAFRSWDTDPPRRIIKDNDFPYFVPKEVEHKVFWCTRLEFLEKPWIEQFVRLHFPHHDVICWVNPTHLRSFPMIPHAHLLLRPKERNSTLNDNDSGVDDDEIDELTVAVDAEEKEGENPDSFITTLPHRLVASRDDQF